VGAADQLIQSSLLGEAVDRGPALVFVADEEMRYIAVNQRACEVLGYDREALLGLRVTDIARDPSTTGEYVEMIERGGRNGASILTCKDGSEVVFRYQAGEATVAGLPFYIAVGFVD
jgi:PAS domain S-box-containing protein